MQPQKSASSLQNTAKLYSAQPPSGPPSEASSSLSGNEASNGLLEVQSYDPGVLDGHTTVAANWAGTHIWTIDYSEVRLLNKDHWSNTDVHSDPFTIAGHTFTMIVDGSHFRPSGSFRRFGVCVCPSEEIFGCLLISFNIHLRFNGADPLPSGQSACNILWGNKVITSNDMTRNKTHIEEYCRSVTHGDLVDEASPFFQGMPGKPVIIVEVCFCLLKPQISLICPLVETKKTRQF